MEKFYLTHGKRKLWQAWGFGLMYAAFNAFASNSAITFTTSVKGIEGIDATSIIHPPGGNPIGTSWDVPLWNFTSYTSAPTEYKPTAYNKGISPVSLRFFSSRGWALDFAKSDPTFIAAITGDTNGKWSMYSTDKGVSWSFSADQNVNVWQAPGGSFVYGSIAVSTPSNIVILTGGGLFYTTNGGVNWNAAELRREEWSVLHSSLENLFRADPNTPNKFLITLAK